MTFRPVIVTPAQRPLGLGLSFTLAVPLALSLATQPTPVGASAGNVLPNRAIVRLIDQQNLGSPLVLITSVVARPFNATDWPVPRGLSASIALRSHLEPLKLNLVGKDTFFGAAGQPPAHLDWQNPRGALVRESDRGYLDPTEFWLLTTLPPKPFANQDWPLPRGAIASVLLRTHIEPIKLLLAGQDAFFGAPGQPPANLDWQNPRGGRAASGLREFTRGFSASDLTVVYPFTQYEWPVPKGTQPSIFLRTLVQGLQPSQLVTNFPVFNYDWPVPRGAVYPVALRGSLDAMRRQLIGQDSFFAGPGRGPSYDWPNPRGASYPLSLRILVDPLKILFPAGIFENSPRVVVTQIEMRISTVSEETRVVIVGPEGRTTGGS